MSVVEAEPSIEVDLDRARLGLGGALSVASAHGRELMLPDYLDAVGERLTVTDEPLARDRVIGMIATEMGLLQAFMAPPSAPYSSEFIRELVGHYEAVLAKEEPLGWQRLPHQISRAARMALVDLIEGLW